MNKKEKVYAFLLHEARVPLSEDEIAAILDVPAFDRFELTIILEELTHSGLITSHKGRFAAKKTLSDDAVMQTILSSHGFPPEFPEEVQKAAKRLPASVESFEGREDLRHLLTFTIDGADARDFDDAISIIETDAGYTLYVHIADVAHYVKYNGIIDKEAGKRGTSCYLPCRNVPMLPRELSNGICSLNPNVDRLTLSTVIFLDKQGNVLDFRITEAVIRSDYRLIYEEVTKVLENGKPDKKHESVFAALKALDALSDLLTARRKEKGSIDFNLPEAKIIFDGKKPVSIEKREEGRANRMIETAMVLCNRIIAEYINKKGLPFVYRVHEKPDRDKLERLSAALGVLGLSIPGRFSGKKAAELLESEKGKDREYIVSTILLRAMMKAKYSPENLGHFGLGLSDYCHFTSPIRRYPDLCCHRIVKALLKGEDTKKFQNKVSRYALHSSEREEAAQEAEREAVRYYMCRCMEDRIGEEFDAVISSVLDFGFFVSLPNLAEGLVHVRTLGDDYYIFDETTLSLTGKRGGAVYRLGDKVEVRLQSVDAATSRIDFVLKEAPENGKNHRTKQKSKTRLLRGRNR